MIAIKTVAQTEPTPIVTLLEAKQYLRVLSDSEDDLIKMYCGVSAKWANGVCKRQFSKIELISYFELAPGESASFVKDDYVITGIKLNNVAVLTSGYTVSENANYVYIGLVDELAFGSLEIAYTLGNVEWPEDVKMACLLKIGSLYDKRDEGNKRFMTSAEDLLLPYRMYNI
jgi:hypothetical protein